MESKHASFHAATPDRFHKFVGLFLFTHPVSRELEQKEFRGKGKEVVYPSAASLVAWTQPDGKPRQRLSRGIKGQRFNLSQAAPTFVDPLLLSGERRNAASDGAPQGGIETTGVAPTSLKPPRPQATGNLGVRNKKEETWTGD